MPGRSITYERVPDYWGGDLPVNTRPQQFRRACATTTSATATSRSKRSRPASIDLRRREQLEGSGPPAMTGPRCDTGLITKEEIPTERRTGMQGFVFNYAARCSRIRGCARRWPMRSTSSGPTRTCSTAQYTRTTSYFSNSELAATGLPRRGRAGAPRAVPRPMPRRGVHAGVQAAEDRRLRQQPRRPARRPELLKEAGWESRTASSSTPDRRAVRVRDPAGPAGVRAHRRCRSCSNLRAPGHRRAVRTVDARNTRTASTLRFRHGRASFGQCAVAGQRAARFLGLAGGGRAGSRNLPGDRGPGGRCADRAGHQGAEPRALVPPTRRSTACCCGANT